MNPRLQKISDEIGRIRTKITDYQFRLKDLERQKTELENADIVAMVRGIDIPPEQFAEFIRAYQAQRDCAVPDIENNHQEEDL